MESEKVQTALAKSPEIDYRKRLQIVTFFTRYFFMGVEYSLIYSSLLLYMSTFTSKNIYAGIAVAFGELSAMIAFLVVGYLYDQYKRPKEILLILNCFQIVGNITYSLPFSKWLLIFGRFFSGFGNGFLILVVGEVTYFYDSSKRIGILSLLESAQVVGMIVGSVITFYLDKKTTHLGRWVLNSYTIPGLLMAIIWLLLQAQTAFCASNLTKELLEDEKHSSVAYKSLLQHSEVNENGEAETSSCDEEEHLMLIRGESNTTNKESDTIPSSSPQSQSYMHSIGEICAIEFYVIFSVGLILLYTKATYELLLPYIAEIEYHWSTKAIGMYYIIGALTVLIIFGIMYFFSRRHHLNDAYLLIFALTLTLINLIMLVLESVVTTHKLRVAFYLIACVVFSISLPFNLVCIKSLLTKITLPHLQGIFQGITFTVSKIALIGGPILFSVVGNNRKVYGIVATTITSIVMVGLVLSLKRIAQRERDVANSSVTSN